MKALLIPVKDPTGAKSRLSDLLSGDQRRRLAWAMFEDVARAASSAKKPDRVVLVSCFAPAIERARGLGWDVLIESSQTSESESVDWASRILSERGFDTVMRLPADLPLIRAEDIDGILSIELDQPGALLVPSRDGTGTNTIVRTPPALFPSRFGPNSLALHQQEAEQVGVDCLLVDNPRIALDIDEPADINALLEAGRDTETYGALVELDVLDRLKSIERKEQRRG